MKDNKSLIKCTLIMALCGIIVPLFLDWFIWSNDFPSSISNEDWSGFLGSYLGGIIGGIGTLAAVYFTTMETRRVQREEMRKEKYWRCIEQMALYYHDLIILKELLKNILNRREDKENYRNASNIIRSDLERLNGLESEKQKEELQKRLKTKTELISDVDMQINKLIEDIIQKRDNLRCICWLISVIAMDVPGVEEIAILMNNIEKNVRSLYDANFDFQDSNMDYKNIVDDIDDFKIKCDKLLHSFENSILNI